MEQLNAREALEIDLGIASIETRGGGLGEDDEITERFPVTGIADD